MAWWKKKTIIEEEIKEAIPDVPVEQHIPVMGKQIREFTALKAFYSEDFQCTFKPGRVHKLRTSDSDHPDSDAAKLKALLPQWEADGKIKWVV